jgi:cell division protein YceG involved in septum cleavage
VVAEAVPADGGASAGALPEAVAPDPTPPAPPPPPGRAGAPPLPPPAAQAPAPDGPAPRSRRRSWPARIAALIALLAVIGALFLLFHSLFGSSHAKPPPPPAVVKVVIPEGQTRSQIGLTARRAGLRGSYRAATKRSPLLDPGHYGAPAHTPDLEGFLFPATYDANPSEPVGHLVDQQLVAFKEHFGAEELARAKALGVTPYELLIVASMIEREAKVPGDRAKIAAVIYNRLARGIPLGVDATIYYAIEQRAGIPTYTRELTESQLHIDSPYNTRTHTGLPPTPISNPGAASIEAAANPAHVPYLYYVTSADGCGEQLFSTTQAQFEANAAAYHAALAAGGGHLPKCTNR